MSSTAATIEVETDRSNVASQRLSYARLTVVGLLVIALGSLLATVPEPFIGPVAALLSLAVAALVWRFGRWTILLGALYAIPPLIMSAALFVLALIYPDSFLQFVPLVLVLGIGSRCRSWPGSRPSPATDEEIRTTVNAYGAMVAEGHGCGGRGAERSVRCTRVHRAEHR